ncbi:MAG: nicotinate-nucleotide--dimethylbenzimidazole phosphoribosyltransferase [Omnitrophica bacterium GWA2_52_8]|nr:MAG: nicotinate-nucleotide--dimethylbenzimidazole phosphoribosyltransferase [Omnitrophica bacterium GWA2_52_8]
MPPFDQEINKIEAPDPVWIGKARQRLSSQTRPEGSLGLLEGYLERISGIQKQAALKGAPKHILLFAADHGVADENVSLYPKSVTASMVMNFLNGGATINSLARSASADVKVIDAGVDFDFQNDPRLISKKIGPGTRNMTKEAAMSGDQLNAALQLGWDSAAESVRGGAVMLGFGEMGIANTTAASAVVAALLKVPPIQVTGRGTGLKDKALSHKIGVIEKALVLHRDRLNHPYAILRCVGGYEIAALTGAILACARYSVPAVIDGWIVSAAALAAVRVQPDVAGYLFFAHQSEEPGHNLLLEALRAKPMFNLGMRLGEASGAALGMMLLAAAVRVYNEVATFEEAGVADKAEEAR